MGKQSYLFLPEPSQRFVRGTDLPCTNHLPDKRVLPVVHEHPVAAEFPADGKPALIDGTIKTIASGFTAEEGAWLFTRSCGRSGLSKVPVGNLVRIFAIYVYRKQVAGQRVPAIIITVIQLALYGDEGTKAGAALPAGITDESGHTMIASMTAILIKVQDPANAFHPSR